MFSRTPVVGFSLQGLSENECATINEAVEGLHALAIPVVVEKNFSVHAFQKCDAVFLAPKFVPEALAAGLVVVSRKQEGLETYRAVEETGNGFFYDNSNKWEIFATLVRMLETYQFPYDWENLKSVATTRERSEC